jgi:putative ABC transport system permease protein
LAPYIAQNIASVEFATRFRFPVPFSYLVDDKPVSLMTYFVDDSFVDVLQIKMITGENPKAILKNPGNIIISEKTASILFPEENPIGQQIRDSENIYTVCGICKDIPKNSYLDNPQVIIGTKEIPEFLGGNTAWFTLLRTSKNTNLRELNTQINTLLEPLFSDWYDEGTGKITFRANHLHNYVKESEAGSHAMLSILAFALLLIAGLNCALLSFSSLTFRAKEVGVRKTAGARAAGIFSLIMWETFFYVLAATLLAACLFWGFKPHFEHIIENYEDIFAIENLWAVGVILVTLIVISGIIPAWIFSKTPVTQVFQRFTAHRFLGKSILLFIQFTASIFVICFLFIILQQYYTSSSRDCGYDKDKLIWTRIHNTTEAQREALIAEICSDSRVEAVSLSSGPLFYGFSGIAASMEQESNEPFHVRWLGVDSSFFKTHGIPILYGSNNLTATYDKGGNVVVNQALLDKLNITGNPIGQVIYKQYAPATIVGVCGNIETLWQGLQPMVLTANESVLTGTLTVRVKEVNTNIVETIKEKMKPFYQNAVAPEVNIYSENIDNQFKGVRMIRNQVIIASIFLLLITIMGILGYVNMETRRRTKEIAIRKIHGSTTAEIIRKSSLTLILIALLSATVAIPFAYIYGSYFQQEFPVKANLSWYLFACATLLVVITIAVCVVLQTWRAANANPAKSIKSE